MLQTALSFVKMSCIYNIVCSIVLRCTAQKNASIKASSSALMHCTLLLVSVGGLLQIQDAFVLFDRLTKILQLLYCACGMALLRDSVGALLQRLLKVSHSGHSVFSNFAPMCVSNLVFIAERLLKVTHSGHSVFSNFAPMCVPT